VASIRVVKVDADSEIANGVRHAAASDEPLVVDTGDATYEVRVEPGHRSAQDSDRERIRRSQEAIRAAAGSWKGLVDAEALKRYLRERRRTANRPSIRL